MAAILNLLPRLPPVRVVAHHLCLSCGRRFVARRPIEADPRLIECLDCGVRDSTWCELEDCELCEKILSGRFPK